LLPALFFRQLQVKNKSPLLLTEIAFNRKSAVTQVFSRGDRLEKFVESADMFALSKRYLCDWFI